MCDISGSRLLRSRCSFFHPPTDCKQHKNASPELWFSNVTLYQNHMEGIKNGHCQTPLLELLIQYDQDQIGVYKFAFLIRSQGDACATGPTWKIIGLNYWPIEWWSQKKEAASPKDHGENHQLIILHMSKKSPPIGFEPMYKSLFFTIVYSIFNKFPRNSRF